VKSRRLRNYEVVGHRDEKYCEIAARRMAQETLGLAI
jgi:hypothetical protein